MNKTIEEILPILREAGRVDLADRLTKLDTTIVALNQNIGELMANVHRQHELVASACIQFAREGERVRTSAQLRRLVGELSKFGAHFATKEPA